jgi:Holliday junction DNA helicase RuvA
MITYVKGELTELSENSIVVECYGVGYEIMVPASIISELPSIGENIKVYTFQYVREDILDLYGFLTKDDLKIFKLLITVNGIGPKGALSILSVIRPDELRLAVLSGDVKAIQKAPGIGGKTAQKLIIELKDKLDIEDVINKGFDNPKLVQATGSVRDEAIEALVSLGYSSSEAIRAVRGIADAEGMESEALLKAALKQLAFL